VSPKPRLQPGCAAAQALGPGGRREDATALRQERAPGIVEVVVVVVVAEQDGVDRQQVLRLGDGAGELARGDA
jgi:predicted RNA methylase